MKNQRPASLSSSLLARLGGARPAATPEAEAESASQSVSGPETHVQNEELAARPSPEASDEDDAEAVQAGEPMASEEASEKAASWRDVKGRVTLSEWAKRSSREMEDLGKPRAQERSPRDTGADGTLRARSFLFVIIAAVLGSLFGLWLGGKEPSAVPSPAAIATGEPALPATAPSSSRDVVVEPLGPAESRPPRSASAPQAAAGAPREATDVGAAATVAALSGVYAVQLAAARSEDVAAREWARLAQQHATLLASAPHEIVRVEIAERGTFYRLRAGNFDTSSEAQVLCTALKSAGQDCLVVKR